MSLENLMTFPRIAEGVATGTLRLAGAYYRIATGLLQVLDEAGTFTQV